MSHSVNHFILALGAIAGTISAATPFAGTWKPIIPPEQAASQLYVSFLPADERGGVRYSEANAPVYSGMLDGTPYPGLREADLSYELTSDGDHTIAVRATRNGQTVRTESLRTSEDGTQLFVASTLWSASGNPTTHGLLYQRAAEPDCGIHLDEQPKLALYGCWVWSEGRQRIEHSPEPITIEESEGGFRITSPSQSFVLRKNGSASVVQTPGGRRLEYSISKWKAARQSIVLTIAAANNAISGTARFELRDSGTMAVTMKNAAGRESEYTYVRR